VQKHRPVAIAPTPRASDWSTIHGRIVYPAWRPLPAVRLVPATTIKDFGFFGFQEYRDVLIDPETRGIANAVVWLRPDSDREDPGFDSTSIHPDLAVTRPRELMILTSPEGFTPRVTAARGGDRIVFSNPTPVPFTVHYQRSAPGGVVSEFNVLLPPGRAHPTRPLAVSRVCDTVTDNIHQWVEARVWVFDHPYFAVTDSVGRFTMADVPTGSWRLVIWHEKAGFGTHGRLGTKIKITREGNLQPITHESPGWGE
jgi:hypothetical protein